MKLRANRNPIARETIKALGAETHTCEIEDLKPHVEQGLCEGGESVYSRIYPLDQDKVIESVVDTKHSLFLTAMIMRNDFWQKLSPEVRAVIKDAAVKAGRKERETTIRDGEEAKAKLIEDGKQIYEPTAEETAEFKEKTKMVYEKFKNVFTPGLIDKIRKT